MAIALSGSLVITGSIFATQGITGSFSGSATSASYADTLQGLGSASFAPAATFNTVSQSFATTSGSLSTRVTNLESTSSTVSSSFASTSGSLSTRVTNLESTSSIVSSSFATTSGSIAGRVTLIEGQYATTGSNTFTGPQYVSQASNAISFTSTASLYTDGGLRVTKDSFVSGTAYFNNVVVYGTSSIEYITSSQVDIGANIITVNTDTPAVRFGGLAVYDSGSTQLTGSMLWDSEKNHWIYSNPSGSTYNSAMLMNGPRNTGSLGNEQGTTSCYLMAGQGGDHITSSQIYTDSSVTCIPNNLIGGTVCSTMTNASCIGVGTFCPAAQFHIFNNNTYSAANLNETTSSAMAFRIRTRAGINTNIVMGAFDSTQAGLQVVDSATAVAGCFLINPYGGNVGIGCIAPIYPLDVKGAAGTIARITDGTSHMTFYAGSGLNEIATVGPMLLTVNGAERLRITSTGITCFACQVCAPAFVGGTVSGTTGTFSGSSTLLTLSSGAGTKAVFATTRNFSVNRNFQIAVDEFAESAFTITPSTTLGGSGYTTPIFTLAAAGAATFACNVQATTLSVGGTATADQLSINNGTSNSYATLRLAGSNRGGQINFYNQSYPTAQILVDQSGNIDFLTGVFAGASVSTKFSITNTGGACFACQVCTPSLVACTTSAAAITIDGYSKLSFKDRGTEYGTINASRYNFGGESTMMSFQSGNCFLFLNGTNCLMFIGSNGNVGIGTSSPLTKLHVEGSSGIRVSDSSGATYRGISFGATPADAVEYAYIKYQPNAGQLIFFGSPSGFGGNTIFQNNASTWLSVNSSNALSFTGAATFSSSVTATSFSTSARSRISENSGTVPASTATTIFTKQSSNGGGFVLVTGRTAAGNWFFDTVAFLNDNAANAISSQNGGSPPSRTYSVSGQNLQLTVATALDNFSSFGLTLIYI